MKFSQTNEEIIKQWNNHEIVFTAELGGLGPGYEQAIQELLFEIFSTWDKEQIAIVDNKPTQEFKNHASNIISEMDSKYEFSGAQVGIAKVTAAQFIHYGYSNMLNKLDPERLIQVTKIKS